MVATRSRVVLRLVLATWGDDDEASATIKVALQSRFIADQEHSKNRRRCWPNSKEKDHHPLHQSPMCQRVSKESSVGCRRSCPFRSGHAVHFSGVKDDDTRNPMWAHKPRWPSQARHQPFHRFSTATVINSVPSFGFEHVRNSHYGLQGVFGGVPSFE